MEAGGLKMKDSYRVPGYSYRRSGIHDLKHFVEQNAANYDVQQGDQNDKTDLVQTPQDAHLAGDSKKSSPLQ